MTKPPITWDAADLLAALHIAESERDHLRAELADRNRWIAQLEAQVKRQSELLARLADTDSRRRIVG